jgi:hypothetical protein
MARLALGILTLFLLLPLPLCAIDFDELDLPPAGAHGGQMLLGFFVTAGFAGGPLISAEEDFIQNSTYTFENETTKLIELAHLPLSFGVNYEYMPIDYVGIRGRIRRTWVIQRSTFGSDYENKRGTLYSDYSLLLAIAVHATNRKQWDFSFAPIIGYSFFRYTAASVPAKLFDNLSSKNRTGSGFVYGVELNAIVYFSGGLFISLGYEWMRNPVAYSDAVNLTNPQTGAGYADTSGGHIDTNSVIITVGYAFSN